MGISYQNQNNWIEYGKIYKLGAFMNIMGHIYLNEDLENWIRSFHEKPNTAVKMIRDKLLNFETAQKISAQTATPIEKINKRLDKIEEFLNRTGNF
jgi:hypothetical protein